MGIKSFAREIITRLVAPHGYELKEVDRPIRRPGTFLNWCATRGFSPSTVIDIGAADGTPWLYESFPEAYLVLVEPNKAFKEKLERILFERRGELHLVGAGSKAGKMSFNLNEERPTSSSILEMNVDYRDKLKDQGVVRTESVTQVEVRPMDDLRLERSWEAPVLVKIDTEGYELAVIEGAVDTVRDAEMVIIEVSVGSRFENSYRFGELLSKVESLGFEVFDIVDMAQIKSGRLASVDVVFVKQGSDLLTW